MRGGNSLSVTGLRPGPVLRERYADFGLPDSLNKWRVGLPNRPNRVISLTICR
jgi:hypothetical protein